MYINIYVYMHIHMNLNLNYPSLYSYLHNRISILCPQTAGLRRHHELVHCTEIPQVRSNLGCERFGWKPKPGISWPYFVSIA